MAHIIEIAFHIVCHNDALGFQGIKWLAPNRIELAAFAAGKPIPSGRPQEPSLLMLQTHVFMHLRYAKAFAESER